MDVLRTRLVKRLRDADRKGRFHVYYTARRGPQGRTLPRRALQDAVVDDQAARRLGQLLQPLDGPRHRVRRRLRGGGDRAHRAAVIARVPRPADRRAPGRAAAEWFAGRAEKAPCSRPSPRCAASSARCSSSTTCRNGPMRWSARLGRRPRASRYRSTFGVSRPRGPAAAPCRCGVARSPSSPPSSRPFRRALALHAARRVRDRRARHRSGRTRSRQWWAPLVVILAYMPARFIMFPRPLPHARRGGRVRPVARLPLLADRHRVRRGRDLLGAGGCAATWCGALPAPKIERMVETSSGSTACSP